MWKFYFGAGAKIIGLDINPECKQHEQDRVHVYIGSQDDPTVIEEILREHGAPDIVIDDGSHQMSHMIKTFQLLYHRVSPRGVYFVEDTHTCYWPKYDGGLKRDGTFIEFTKERLDELTAAHTNGLVAVTDFTCTTRSVTIYDSVCVFEQAPQGRRTAFVTEALASARLPTQLR
jgi:hypothetical protein